MVDTAGTNRTAIQHVRCSPRWLAIATCATVKVRLQADRASIEVLLDGKKHLSWKGQQKSVQCSIGKPRQLAIAGWGPKQERPSPTVTFHSVRVTPLDSVPLKPSEPVSRPPEGPKKCAVPSAETQRQVGDVIEETYKISQAKTPEAKIKLARELFDASKKTPKPNEQYVLLHKAAELACDGSDAAIMLEMLLPMTDTFAIDPLNAKAAMLERFAKGPRNAARVQSLVEGSRSVIDEAVAENRYEVAASLAKSVADACVRSSPQLRKEVAERRKKVQQLQEQSEAAPQTMAAFQQAMERLKKNPEDADANLTIGAWYCLVHNDWQTGLPYLTKGSDAVLKALAQRELSSPPTNPEDQVKLADAWWDGSGDRRGDEKTAFLLRAGHWYKQSLPKLEGVNKTKVEKRLAEIAQVGQDLAPFPGHLPPLAVAPFNEKTARLHQARWAKYLRVSVVQTNSIGMKLVLIPPGEFDMGSPKDLIEEELRLHGSDGWYRDHLPGEAPRHRVRITKPYWLGVTEVTQEEYQRVIGSNPSKFQGDLKRPVEQISRDDAVEFCRRLSELPSEKGAKQRYQLPTEAQWEYACRAGNPGPWSFSPHSGQLPATLEEKLLGEYAWFNANAGGQTHPVGQKRQTSLACTTCLATCGNGVRTGMIGTIMRSRLRTIRWDLPEARPAWVAAVAGTARRGAAGRRTAASSSRPGTAAATWASVSA